MPSQFFYALLLTLACSTSYAMDEEKRPRRSSYSENSDSESEAEKKPSKKEQKENKKHEKSSNKPEMNPLREKFNAEIEGREPALHIEEEASVNSHESMVEEEESVYSDSDESEAPRYEREWHRDLQESEVYRIFACNNRLRFFSGTLLDPFDTTTIPNRQLSRNSNNYREIRLEDQGRNTILGINSFDPITQTQGTYLNDFIRDSGNLVGIIYHNNTGDEQPHQARVLEAIIRGNLGNPMTLANLGNPLEHLKILNLFNVHNIDFLAHVNAPGIKELILKNCGDQINHKTIEKCTANFPELDLLALDNTNELKIERLSTQRVTRLAIQNDGDRNNNILKLKNSMLKMAKSQVQAKENGGIYFVGYSEDANRVITGNIGQTITRMERPLYTPNGLAEISYIELL